MYINIHSWFHIEVEWADWMSDGCKCQAIKDLNVKEILFKAWIITDDASYVCHLKFV